MLPIKPDGYGGKMLQDNISVIFKCTCEDAYLKVRFYSLQEFEKKRPQEKFSLCRVDSTIMHQGFIQIQKQCELVFGLMVQVRRGTGRQIFNAPTFPVISDQLGRIELQKIIIKQIGGQRLKFRQLNGDKSVKITMELSQTVDLLKNFILDRKERERREICGILAQVFMAVGQEKGTERFLCDLLVDERIEVEEVFGEMGEERLVLAELAAEQAFNNQKKEDTLEVNDLLYSRLRLFFTDAQLEIAEVALLLKDVIFDGSNCLARFPSFQDDGEQVSQMKDVVCEVFYLGACHFFDHIQFIYFFTVFVYNNGRLFGGFEQLHSFFALVVLADLKLIAKLKLSNLFILFSWIFFNGCQLFANTERERKDGVILLVAFSLKTRQLVGKVLVKGSIFLILWSCLFELFI